MFVRFYFYLCLHIKCFYNIVIMEEKFKFTDEERTTLLEIAEQLKSLMGDEYTEEDAVKVRAQIESELQENKINRDVFGLNPILMSFRTALLELEEIGMKRDCVLSILLYNSVANESRRLRKFSLSITGDLRYSS